MIAQQLNKIAKQNDPAKNAAAGSLLQQNYSAASLGKTVLGFGKDLGKVAWKHKDHFKDFVKSGAVIAGTGYVADKIIQGDLKKQEKQQLPLKTYSASSVLLKGGKTLLKASGDVVKNNKLSVAIGAIPLIGYTTQRLAEKNMVDDVSTSPAQQEEKSYSAASFAKGAVNIGKSVGKKIANSAKFTYRHPSASLKKTGKSVLNGVSSFMGGGGYSGVKNVGKEILNVGQKSGNKLTQKVGNAIINNPNLAVAASIPVGSAVIGAGFSSGDAIVRKPLKAIDKNAFKYSESQEKPVNE